MNFEDIKKANNLISSIDVKGKQYAEVNQRVKAFRYLFPEGTITTEIVSNENGVCVMKANVYNKSELLATGLAYEKESSSFINKTSYIENCETSAVGRALGFLGLGIDTSICSAEELQNAINNQNKDTLNFDGLTKEQITTLQEGAKAKKHKLTQKDVDTYRDKQLANLRNEMFAKEVESF